MKMFNPPHPGEVIKELCIKPLGLTVTEAAQKLGVARNTLSRVLNGQAGISPEMAVKLSIVFCPSAESWLRQQMEFDLWQAEQKRGEFELNLVPFKKAA
jgi:addiction module HigA family antidote